jgi:tetratricopeptide (TPR) repeat protein
VHAGFGRTLDARRAASQAALEAEIERRLGLEIAARRERQLQLWREEAAAAAARRDFARAAELYRDVLTWSRDDAEAGQGLRRARFEMHVQQADSLAARHDFAAARGVLEDALGLCPGDSLATARLHDVQTSLKRVQSRRDAAAERFRQGLEAYAVQRWTDAIECFEAVLALAPGDADAATYLAQARAAVATLVQEGLRDARARLERRDLEGARAALAPVLQLDAKQPEANRILAQIGQEQERLDHEQRLAQERRAGDNRRAAVAPREDRSPPAIPAAQVAGTYDRGLALYRGGDLVGAMQAWEEVARSVPHYQEVDQYLLRVYRVCGLESYTEGRLRQAIEIWEKALRLEPGNAQVRRYLNQAHAKLRRAESGESAR